MKGVGDNEGDYIYFFLSQKTLLVIIIYKCEEEMRLRGWGGGRGGGGEGKGQTRGGNECATKKIFKKWGREREGKETECARGRRRICATKIKSPYWLDWTGGLDWSPRMPPYKG